MHGVEALVALNMAGTRAVSESGGARVVCELMRRKIAEPDVQVSDA